MFSQETLELCEQCTGSNYVKEIEHLNGTYELATYHVVEREKMGGSMVKGVYLP